MVVIVTHSKLPHIVLVSIIAIGSTYSNEKHSPEFHYSDHFDSEVPPESIVFKAYAARSRNETMCSGADDIKKLILDQGHPVKVFIHGFYGSYFWYNTTMEAYQRLGSHNIIQVNWFEASNSLNYIASVLVVASTARIVADVLEQTSKANQIPMADFHLIGHSLGSHIAGFIGKDLTGRGLRLGRITGLDPALPGFIGIEDNSRLSWSDADFVDVIHTAGGITGIFEPMGHIDFYPNGGLSNQTGCKENPRDPEWNMDFFQDYMVRQVVAFCSHARSLEYFTESINSMRFVGIKCKARDEMIERCNPRVKNIMGEHVKRQPLGSFYLETNSALPFARGDVYFPSENNL